MVGLDLDLAGLWPEQPKVLIAPVGADRDAIPGLVGVLERALAQAARAIVVVPGWLEDTALQRVQTAAALLDTDRLAVHRSALPPLAASVTAALAAAMAPAVAGAGPLAGALPAIERELLVVAWLGTVSGLKQPAPSIAQHARSSLPGAAFAVRVQPGPFVRTLGRDGTGAPLEPPERPLELIIAPGEAGDVEWVLEVAVPDLGDPPVRQVEQTRGAAAWWGTGKLVEVVGHPTDLVQLAHRTVPGELVACRWCAEPIAAAQPCPFCGERNRSGQAGSHPGVGPSAPRS